MKKKDVFRRILSHFIFFFYQEKLVDILSVVNILCVTRFPI